jgi:hypothetical protein
VRALFRDSEAVYVDLMTRYATRPPRDYDKSAGICLIRARVLVGVDHHGADDDLDPVRVHFYDLIDGGLAGQPERIAANVLCRGGLRQDPFQRHQGGRHHVTDTGHDIGRLHRAQTLPEAVRIKQVDARTMPSVSR